MSLFVPATIPAFEPTLPENPALPSFIRPQDALARVIGRERAARFVVGYSGPSNTLTNRPSPG